METAALIVSHSVENFQSPDSHQPLPHVKNAVNRGKMKREEQLGRKTPCGYRKDEQQKKIVIHEESAWVVLQFLDMREAGSGPWRSLHGS